MPPDCLGVTLKRDQLQVVKGNNLEQRLQKHVSGGVAIAARSNGIGGAQQRLIPLAVRLGDCRCQSAHRPVRLSHRLGTPQPTPSKGALPIRGYVSSDVVKRQKASTKCRCLRHMSNPVSGRLTGCVVNFRPPVRNLPSVKHFRTTQPWAQLWHLKCEYRM